MLLLLLLLQHLVGHEGNMRECCCERTTGSAAVVQEDGRPGQEGPVHAPNAQQGHSKGTEGQPGQLA